MEWRTLGKTGLRVSRIGLGLAAIGRPGYITLGHSDDLGGEIDAAVMESRARAVLDAAFAVGVRYFDAARSYGRAEAFLASWLRTRGLEPGSVVVGSKWGYAYTAGWKTQAERHEIKDHSLAALLRQSSESLETLGPYLGLYQVHSATLESGVLDDRSVHEELARRKLEGWAIGFSASGPRQAEVIRKALTVTTSRGRLFDCVQATWNILDPSAGEALAQAHAEGLGVIVKEALANGRLTPRNADPAFTHRRQSLEHLAAGRNASIDAIAVAAVLEQPWADVVLSGAATIDQIRSNVSALDVVMDRGAREALGGFSEPPESYWNTRSRLPWN